MKKLFLTVILLSIISLSMNAQINLQNGLVANYFFNGNALDESGNGNNANLNSATLTTDRFSVDNHAYLFNGSTSKINVPYSASWNFGSGDLSISSWVNVNTISTARIVSAGYEEPNNVWALGFGSNGAWGSGTRINFYDFTTGFVNYNSSEITYTTGQWAHVAVVKSGTSLTFWFNGATAGTAYVTTQSNANSQLTIGARQIYAQDNFSEFLDGKIDDIRIYNRALSEVEIQALYTTTNPTGGTGINADGTQPDKNSMLDVKATDKGILIPRIDYNDRPTVDVTSGLLVYVIANGPQGNNAFYYFNGTSWVKLAVSSK